MAKRSPFFSPKLKTALKKFSANEVTIAKAARMAGLPLTSFLDLLTERKIFFHYSKEDVKDEFSRLL